MKKQWMILTVALTLSLLTACGGKEPAPASSASAGTQPATSQAEPADKSEATPDTSTQTPGKTETPTQKPGKAGRPDHQADSGAHGRRTALHQYAEPEDREP